MHPKQKILALRGTSFRSCLGLLMVLTFAFSRKNSSDFQYRIETESQIPYQQRGHRFLEMGLRHYYWIGH